MKKILSLMALTTLFSANLFALTTTCSGLDQNDNNVEISIDSREFKGQLVTNNEITDLRVYIMNDNSPGFYYYEGLTKSKTGDNPEMFRMKLSRDNTSADLQLSTVGRSNVHRISVECDLSN